MIPRYRSADSLLLLIDCQRGVDDLVHWGGAQGRRNNPDAEARMLELLEAWRARGLPVAYTQHDSREAGSPLRLDRPGGELKPGFAPRAGERVYRKTMNSAFADTALDIDLRQRGTRRLVIAGFFTAMCVSTSVRWANNLGFDVTLVEDGCATANRSGPDGRDWDPETVHAVTVAALHGEFCTALAQRDVLTLLEQDRPDLRRAQGNE